MLKKVFAVLAGLAVGTIVIAAVETLSSQLYAPPAGLDIKDRVAFAAFIESLPAAAFLFVLGAYICGSLAGGVVASLVSGRESLRPALIVGALLLGFGIVNLILLPHPFWFAVASTLIYIPCAAAGAFLVRRNAPALADDLES